MEGRRRRREAIRSLEAASVGWATLRIAKHAQRRSLHRLVPGDNMSVTLSLAKGRASHHRLLLTCRVVFALGVAADIRAHSRWAPSERGLGDQAFRRRQPPARKVKLEAAPHLAGGTG